MSKIAFFVKEGLDSFINDVYDGISCELEKKKIVVKEYSQIDEGMKWADICFFEWCDELIIYASKLPLAFEKKIIVRLHSYEAFTGMPNKVNMNNVDKIIFVSEFIRNYSIKKFKMDKNKTVVIPNGIKLENYKFRKRTPGFDIAYVGYINYKKGPMLLMQTFKEIHDFDGRFKLYMAGVFQDERDVLYFKQMIREMHLEKSIIYDGWQDDIDSWLDDKDYILCTSLLESQNMSVMQAMAKGIKPIIHNFVGAREIYDGEFIFNTPKEAVNVLMAEYDSLKYRRFIEERYDYKHTQQKMISTINNIDLKEYKNPLVSIVVTLFNREKFIKKTLESITSQSYKNIEVIVVDDGSTDNSLSIAKSYNDDRIKCYHKENTGQLDSLKFGINKCSGDYITRVDSDDTIDSEYVKMCLNEIVCAKDCDFVYTDFNLIDDTGKKVSESRFKEYKEPIDIIIDMFNDFSSVIPDMAFWRRKYINEVVVNYADNNIPFYIDSIMTSKYKHINKCMYNYRQHSENFIKKNDTNFKLVIEGKIKFMDFLIRRYIIQYNLLGNFKGNEKRYYSFFIKKYKSLKELYKYKGNEIEDLFGKEIIYWQCRFDLKKASDYVYSNMRILIVSSDNPDQGKAIGGKHVHINLLQKGFKKLGIQSYEAFKEPMPISIDLKKVAQEYGISKEKFMGLKDINAICTIYGIRKLLEEKIAKVLEEHYVSVISCQDVISTMAVYNVLNKLNITIPIITTVHGYFTYENKDYGVLSNDDFVNNYFLNYEKKAYEVSDGIIAVDSRIEKYISDMIKTKKNICVIKNSVNDTEIKPCNNQNDRNIILVPRRLVPKNGVIYAVYAANELIKLGVKNFRMLIAGDGNEALKIKKYISDNKLDDYVILMGSVPHNEILEYFEVSKIVLIPSINSNDVEEATSISALEGMACGKIVIASKIGGLKEIIDNGENGFLVTAKDYNNLADNILKVMQMNKSKYERISLNARKTIEQNYGNDNHTKEYVKFFKTCDI